MQRMVLYDYDWASANDEIGRAQLKISDLQPGQRADLWLDVTSEGEEAAWGQARPSEPPPSPAPIVLGCCTSAPSRAGGAGGAEEGHERA